MGINILSHPRILNVLLRSLQEKPWPWGTSLAWGRSMPGSDTLLGSPLCDSRAPQTFPHSALELRACAPHLEVGSFHSPSGSPSDLST